jgi:hypothetical protein
MTNKRFPYFPNGCSCPPIYHIPQPIPPPVTEPTLPLAPLVLSPFADDGPNFPECTCISINGVPIVGTPHDGYALVYDDTDGYWIPQNVVPFAGSGYGLPAGSHWIIGTMYFDLTSNRPHWWNGAIWITWS